MLMKGGNFVENEKCNGWTNHDTWSVMVWLDNDQNNYTALKHKVEGVGTNKPFKDLNCCETMEWLKRLHYGDEINWHNVNIEEIRKAIIKDFEEEC